MDLNISDTVVGYRMLENIIGKHVGIDKGQLYSHGKQGVGISAEGLTVEKIAPSAYKLTDEYSEKTAVGKQKEAYLPDPAENKCCNTAGNDTSVYGETALTDIQNADKIVFILIPFEEYIVQSGAYDSEYYGKNKKIIVQIRVIMMSSGIMLYNKERQQHADADDYSVKCNFKIAEYGNMVGKLSDDDTKMREYNVSSIEAHKHLLN